jgi:hypothetical protein
VCAGLIRRAEFLQTVLENRACRIDLFREFKLIRFEHSPAIRIPPIPAHAETS